MNFRACFVLGQFNYLLLIITSDIQNSVFTWVVYDIL